LPTGTCDYPRPEAPDSVGHRHRWKEIPRPSRVVPGPRTDLAGDSCFFMSRPAGQPWRRVLVATGSSSGRGARLEPVVGAGTRFFLGEPTWIRYPYVTAGPFRRPEIGRRAYSRVGQRILSAFDDMSVLRSPGHRIDTLIHDGAPQMEPTCCMAIPGSSRPGLCCSSSPSSRRLCGTNWMPLSCEADGQGARQCHVTYSRSVDTKNPEEHLQRSRRFADGFSSTYAGFIST